MTEQELTEWFLKSYENLVLAVFRCMGGRNRQDAEDVIQEVFVGMLTKWEEYGKRIYRDETGKVRMRKMDGNPGATLYAYVMTSACSAAVNGCESSTRREKSWKKWVRSRKGKELFQSPSNPLYKINVSTAFQDCWKSLPRKNQVAIRKRHCPQDKITKFGGRGQRSPSSRPAPFV